MFASLWTAPRRGHAGAFKQQDLSQIFVEKHTGKYVNGSGSTLEELCLNRRRTVDLANEEMKEGYLDKLHNSVQQEKLILVAAAPTPSLPSQPLAPIISCAASGLGPTSVTPEFYCQHKVEARTILRHIALDIELRTLALLHVNAEALVEIHEFL